MLSVVFIFFFRLEATQPAQTGRFSVYINGPSISKHFDRYYSDYNDFHPGIGGEFYYHKKRWTVGFNGHYMFKDSSFQKSYWFGVVNGITFGNRKKFWIEPSIIAGGIKKAEYNDGKFGIFAMPLLSVGYNRLGFNIAYIPYLRNMTYPILLVQIKIQVL
jgi:hypothetical protein